MTRSARRSPPLQRRRLLLAGLLLPLGRPMAFDNRPPPEVLANIQPARLQGSGKLRFFGFDVYDARLWVGAGFRAEAYERSPLALELAYSRTLYGRLIAERTLSEMKNLAAIDESRAQAWLDELVRIFPDVKPGNRITGIQFPGESTRFFLDGNAIGQLRDPQFTRLFFGIWLSAQTSEPGLRNSLIGVARGVI